MVAVPAKLLLSCAVAFTSSMLRTTFAVRLEFSLTSSSFHRLFWPVGSKHALLWFLVFHTYLTNLMCPASKSDGLLIAPQRHRCPRCDEPSDAHVRTYTHRQGSLTISVRRLKRGQMLPAGTSSGEPRIWMWHRCLRCPRDANGLPPSSKRVVMSDAASSLSFGKFLELSFSNHVAASRLASCGHSIHRDCLRFYGCEGMIACFRYAPILLHAVHLPDPRLEFNNPSQQQWLVDEVHDVADKVRTPLLDASDWRGSGFLLSVYRWSLAKLQSMWAACLNESSEGVVR